MRLEVGRLGLKAPSGKKGSCKGFEGYLGIWVADCRRNSKGHRF